MFAAVSGGSRARWHNIFTRPTVKFKMRSGPYARPVVTAVACVPLRFPSNQVGDISVVASEKKKLKMPQDEPEAEAVAQGSTSRLTVAGVEVVITKEYR